MPNQPSLETINKIADGNLEFKSRLLEIIRRELPIEIAAYNKNFKEGDFLQVAENVHKLNHKINIFEYTNGYLQAVKFEKELRNGDSTSYLEFENTLEVLTKFIKSIK